MPARSVSKNRKTADLVLQKQIEELASGHSSNPFAVLGRHPDGRGDIVPVFFPDAFEVRVVIIPTIVWLDSRGTHRFKNVIHRMLTIL